MKQMIKTYMKSQIRSRESMDFIQDMGSLGMSHDQIGVWSLRVWVWAWGRVRACLAVFLEGLKVFSGNVSRS